MKNTQWQVTKDGIWIFDARPYLFCDVEAVGPLLMQPNGQYTQPFKITLTGADSAELFHDFANAKEAKKFASAIVIDWAQSTHFAMCRNVMPKVVVN